MENKISKQTTKFLMFNNQSIYFIDSDGKYWISYKSICDALQIDANRCYKNLKKHPILGPALANLPMQVSKNGLNQLRNVTCIPEKYVYGWLFTLTGNNKDLIAFQIECHDLLFEHFNGEIVKRKELLLGAADTQKQIEDLKKELYNNLSYKKLLELEEDKKMYSSEMKKIDKIVVSQIEMKFN